MERVCMWREAEKQSAGAGVAEGHSRNAEQRCPASSCHARQVEAPRAPEWTD